MAAKLSNISNINKRYGGIVSPFFILLYVSFFHYCCDFSLSLSLSLSPLRVDKAVSKVYRLAMSDFTNSCLVSSCVAFTEMLSRDSTHLRIDTQSAIRIFNHRMSTEGWGSVTSPVPSVGVKDGGGGGSPVDTGDVSGGGGGGSSSEAGSTVGESDEVNEVVKNKIGKIDNNARKNCFYSLSFSF